MQDEQLNTAESSGKADKRKRSENSSTSELDTSKLDTVETSTKSKRKAKKMSKQEQTIDEYFTSEKDEKQTKSELIQIKLQLKEVNSKLTNVISKVEKTDQKLEHAVRKDDGSLRTLFRESMVEMKEELLNSVINRLEMLESRLYDRDQKNDELKAEVTRLQKENVDQKTLNEKLKRKVEENYDKLYKTRNETEQYSRVNNIRIHGIPSSKAFENADETTETVIKTLNEKMGLTLRTEDVDVAHRLHKSVRGSQEAIVRLQSRLVKDKILRNRRTLKGTNIFINEDLTQLNQNVLMSVKRKKPQEVRSVFTRNGTIKYVTHTNEVKTVLYPDYQYWMDLPWPNQGQPPTARQTPNRDS